MFQRTVEKISRFSGLKAYLKVPSFGAQKFCLEFAGGLMIASFLFGPAISSVPIGV